MAKTLKIFDDDGNLIHEGVLSVNTAILKGRLTKDPQTSGKVVRFSLQMSNGKNTQTDQWNKPTYADCSAFGELGEQIFKRYQQHDDIWLVAKFYTNSYEGKVYKGFNVKEVINMKAETPVNPDNMDFVGDNDIPF